MCALGDEIIRCDQQRDVSQSAERCVLGQRGVVVIRCGRAGDHALKLQSTPPQRFFTGHIVLS